MENKHKKYLMVVLLVAVIVFIGYMNETSTPSQATEEQGSSISTNIIIILTVAGTIYYLFFRKKKEPIKLSAEEIVMADTDSFYETDSTKILKVLLRMEGKLIEIEKHIKKKDTVNLRRKIK